MNPRFVLAVGGAMLVAGCYEIRVPIESHCTRAQFIQPDTGMGLDANPVRVEFPKSDREPDIRPKAERTIIYLFQHEPSNTTETLRGVCKMPEKGVAIAVGDHGTVRVRQPLFGWENESPGTDADLHAVTWARLSSPVRGASALPTSVLRDPFVAVGAHGVAAVRGRDASWRLEATGTTQNLVSVAHFGDFTLAAGAGGTLVERTTEGVWRAVDAHTTADLAWVGWLNGRIGAVGASGAIIDCVREGERLVCIPRPSHVDADLFTASTTIFGRGVRLGSHHPNDWDPISDVDAPWFHDVEIHAAANDIAVGRGGLVLILSKAFGAPSSSSHGRLELPKTTDLHAVAFDGVTGYAVGAQGSIVHIGVHGNYRMATCEL